MPWCPKCRNEYVAGRTHCPDCDVDLVEELPMESEKAEEAPEDFEFPEDFDPGIILEGPKEKPAPVKPYKSPEERYADMQSSAWTFLLVGGLGLIVMILALMGIFTFPFHDFALYVMLLLFASFTILGISSFQNSRKLKALILSENAKIQEITDWYRTEGIHSKAMTALDASLPEEIFYLQKYETISQILREHFSEIPEDLLNKLASDFSEED